MSDTAPLSTISRRSFLSQAGLFGLIAWNPALLLSCGDEKAFKGSGAPPFSIWEEVLEALKTSPDHYQAQRDQALASGDPATMFEFVKNGLTLMPSDPNYFNRIGDGMLYGTSEALRCGMATPREKAEILKDMFLEAGFEARVVYESIPMDEKAVKQILFNQKPAAFNPEITEDMYRQWIGELQITDSNDKVVHIDIEKQAKELCEQLSRILSAENSVNENKIRFYYRQNKVPTVALKINGEEKFAHLFDPSVPFGVLHPANTASKPPEAADPKSIDKDLEIRIVARRATTQKEEIELVKGSWKVSELFGNQIKVQFLNNMTFEEQVHNSISQIQTFTPALSIQNVNQTQIWHEERSVLGEPFDLEGVKILQESQIFQPSGAIADSKVLERVASLEVVAIPKGYPKVSLQVYPRDTEGQIIEGLRPNDFRLNDNETPVSGMMQNNVIAPNILLLYDTSFSMPKSYYGENIDIFVEGLMSAIGNSYPKAKIKPQKTGSNIYTSLYKACLTSNDLIVYATDGHNGDKFNPEDAATFSEGPPCIFLNVRNNLDKSFNELASNTSATVIPAEDQAQTILKIQSIIEEMEFPPYTINYQSFDRNLPHKITVETGSNPIEASATFKFPDDRGKPNENRLIGLYMDIKVGKEKPIRRTLAGWDSKLRFQPEKAIEMAQSVHEMLLGNVTLAFESAGASLSIRATEYLSALLYDRPWYSALQNNDYEKAFEELKKGRFTYPPSLLSLMQPLADSITPDNITYPMGLRIGALKFKPALYSEQTIVSFDYLPTSKYQSLTPDGLDYFKTTMERTAQMALLEGFHFDHSTLSNLKGLPLRLNRSVTGAERTEFRKLTEDYSYWQENVFRGGTLKLFDSGLSDKSYWQIDPRYGELYGILEDGTGGGGSGQFAQLQELNRVVKGYERVVAMMNYGMMVSGTGGLAMGVVAAYSIALVKLYAGATEAIIIMDAIGLDAAARDALMELACNVYKNIVYGALGPVGMILDGLENLATIMGESVSFLSCP